MELVELKTQHQKKQFIEFIHSLYDGDCYYVDTSIFIVKIFLHKTDTFSRQNIVRPFAVQERGKTLAQCMFIHDSRLPYLQMSFFDALPCQDEAVQRLIIQAKSLAENIGAQKIVIGLNGHVSYGVGILTRGFEKKISFDSLYNKPYYAGYFEANGLAGTTLSTYTFLLDDIRKRINGHGKSYQGFTFRTMRMHDFKNEMVLFGSLCNACLRDTFLYFEREPSNLYELMSGLKPLLRPEHLIFAEKEGRAIGFFFWHPDYNAILPPGKRISLAGFVCRYFLLKSRIDTVKINAIGIIPRYQRCGVVAGLFDAALRRAPARFKYGETNFVWDNNRHSRLLNLGLGNRPDRTYAVYCADCG